MYSADNWKEYRLIDACCGERLERWGDYTLVRPDPQVIWQGERKNPGWKTAQGVYRRKTYVCGVKGVYSVVWTAARVRRLALVFNVFDYDAV